jgi:N-acetylglutamate synthase-like GNAT family acetyltransferase
MPPQLAKSLPKYPAPAIVLARLAVDESMKGQSLGRRLLVDAFHRCLVVAEQIGIHAVFVKAIDTGAAEFYQHFGFIPLINSPLELYLPMSTLRTSLGS